MQDDDSYDYTVAGFDGFLTRSLNSPNTTPINATPPISRKLAYDRARVDGYLGDQFRIGGISFNNTNITANDGENDFFILGDE